MIQKLAQQVTLPVSLRECILVLVFLVTLFIQNGSKITAPSEPESETKNERPIQDDTALVRCFWAGDDEEVAQKRLDVLNAGICSNSFCLASELSQTSNSDFLVFEAIAAQKGVITKEAYFQRLVEEKAQCLFWEREQETLCACTYPTFTEFCDEYIWEETKNWSLEFDGDSTANRFMKGVEAGCLQLRQDRPEHLKRHQKLNKNQTKELGVIRVKNEKTLHYLYLPFYRESDGMDEMLFNFSGSIHDYRNVIAASLQQEVVKRPNLQLVVYMGNNYACDHLYVGNYTKAARFLLENPDLKELQDLMQRRKTDGVSTLGLTLDYYGTQFVSQLAHRYVFGEIMQELKAQNNTMMGQLPWAYLPFPGQNPSICELSPSTDGRHYSLPKSGNYSFYVAKARILHGVIANAMEQNQELS